MLSLSLVLLVLRAIYMCLTVFNGGTGTTWDALNVSLDVLVQMGLLPEYFVVVVMTAVGFWMLRSSKAGKATSSEVEVVYGP